jgi:hypothetical protein
MEAEDIVEIHFQATPSEDIEDLACVILRSNVCELMIALQLFVVTCFKSAVNPISNPNPICSQPLDKWCQKTTDYSACNCKISAMEMKHVVLM